MQQFADRQLAEGLLQGLPTPVGYLLVVGLFAFLLLNFIMLVAGVTSWLERRVLKLFSAHGLELPETNCPAGTYRVDCRWPQHHLTVEIDSYTYHRTAHAWENDRRREREAYARGDDFRRYTRRDVEQPQRMLAELSGLLPSREAEAAPLQRKPASSARRA